MSNEENIEKQADLVSTLALGCMALVKPPTPGALIFTLGTDVTATEKDALLLVNDVRHLTLTASSGNNDLAAEDFEVENCQSCTLFVALDGGVNLLASPRIKVKVHRDNRCHGKDTIVIK
ncbi:MAG: hypothetical protein ABI759_29830 [Candidatus Solibacter sp.]